MANPDLKTLEDKLSYAYDTKLAIKDAIVAKGVDIPENTTFRDYAVKIEEIETGGEVGSLQVTYGGYNRATFYFLDNDGVYQELENPASFQLPYPSVLGVYISPKNVMDPGGNGADFSSEEVEKLEQFSSGSMMAPSIFYFCRTKNSNAVISVS